jgi:hypothetical protein
MTGIGASLPRAELVAAARAELVARERAYPAQVEAGRMSADEAGRGLAAWMAIAALLERGEAAVEPCLGESAAAAWTELLDALARAIDHRIDKGPHQRLPALAAIRSLVTRSAVRQGAVITDPVSSPQRKAA